MGSPDRAGERQLGVGIQELRVAFERLGRSRILRSCDASPTLLFQRPARRAQRGTESGLPRESSRSPSKRARTTGAVSLRAAAGSAACATYITASFIAATSK